jgi:glycosyltransferase involved in cell wall biosynthesis
MAYVSTDPGVPIFGSKGASVHIQEVLSALGRLGARVEVFSSSTERSRDTLWDGTGVHRLDWPKGNLAGAEPAVETANESLRKALEKNGPFNLVYERYALWSYAGMEYAFSTRTRGLLEVNSPLIDEEAKYRGLKNRPYAEAVARRTFRASSVLLAVSNGVAAHLANYSETVGRVHVVPNGVNPARFPADVKASRPAPPGIFTVGFVGSLKPWHGLETLVEAF